MTAEGDISPSIDPGMKSDVILAASWDLIPGTHYIGNIPESVRLKDANPKPESAGRPLVVEMTPAKAIVPPLLRLAFSEAPWNAPLPPGTGVTPGIITALSDPVARVKW